jgi:hypothetical protein
VEVAKTLDDVQTTEADTVIRLIKAQSDFVMTPARYAAYVAAWGTGKTLAGIGRAMRLSEEYPENLGVIFRKEFEDLRDSTVKDFEKYTRLKVNSSREVVLGNRSVIMFRHLEELNNIQNMNLGWFMIEQAEELPTDDPFMTLFGRLRRKGVKQSGFLIANTKGRNWIYKLFKIGGLIDEVRRLMAADPGLFPAGTTPEGMVALFEAKTSDNAHNLDPMFLASLEILKAKKPLLYRRFVENSWEEAGSADIIIQPDWIQAAEKRTLHVRHPIRRIISIDVARSNPGEGDKTVFIAIGNGKEVGWEEHETRNTMEVVGRAVLFNKKLGFPGCYAVDEIGVGGGVADRLAELDDNQVIFVNASERLPGGGYQNRRAEVYDFGAHQFEDGLVQIDPEHEQLREQLSWAKQKITSASGNVYLVQAKPEIKKEFGQSPDHADAFLNGLWALPQVKIAERRDGYSAGGGQAGRRNPATA